MDMRRGRRLRSAAGYLFSWFFLVLASVARPAPVPGVDASNFGSEIVWPNSPNLTTYANHLQNAGVKWARSELIWWGLCEQSPGVYNYNVSYQGSWDCDNWISVLKARGIRPWIILCYGNALYGSGSAGTPNTTASRAAFANYCTALVSRYKDDVDVWEIWNEPNLDQFWGTTPNAADYAALVAAAAQAIRAADPGCTVVGGSTSGIDTAFLTTCFNNGMLQHLDVVSVHPYRINMPESTNAEYASLRSLMNSHANGSNVKIWSGEWGFNAAWTELGSTLADRELAQAKMLSRMMVNNMSQGVDLSIWFSVHGWDTIEDWGLTPWNAPGTARASHQAMTVINRMLPPPVQRIASPYSVTYSPNYSSYRTEVFQRGDTDHRTVALWRARWGPTSATNVSNVTLTVAPEFDLRAYDGLTGSEVGLDARRSASVGKVTLNGLTVADYPLFVEVNRETLPPGQRIPPARVVGYAADSEYPGQPASLAGDGAVTVASKWTSTNTAAPHWLAVQFDRAYPLTGFAVRLPSLAGEEGHFNAKAVEFQTASSLSGPWTTVAAAANDLQHDRIISIPGSPATASCVRLLVTNPGVDNYARIQEFEVYTTDSFAGVHEYELYD